MIDAKTARSKSSEALKNHVRKELITVATVLDMTLKAVISDGGMSARILSHATKSQLEARFENPLKRLGYRVDFYDCHTSPDDLQGFESSMVVSW